jgi:hypothetical protein
MGVLISGPVAIMPTAIPLRTAVPAAVSGDFSYHRVWSCRTTLPGNSGSALASTPDDSLSSNIKSTIEFLGGRTVRAFSTNSGSVHCNLPASQLWTVQEDKIQFAMPRIVAISESWPVDTSGGLRNHCIEIGATYPGNLATIYQSPSVTPPDFNDAYWRVSNSWSDCRTNQGPPYAGFADVLDARIALDDTEKTADLNRSLFSLAFSLAY